MSTFQVPITGTATISLDQLPPGPAGPQGPAGLQGPVGPAGAVSSASSPDQMPAIPASAVSSGVLDNYTAQPWKLTHDAATPGTTANVSTTYRDAVNGRNFHFDYTANAGERFSLYFGDDPSSLNFCYDVEIRFTDPTQILNMELDMNQVMSDGRTVIYDCQCASKSRTWEVNAWNPTRIVGNPQQWGTGWNRVRIFWHRSADGNTVFWDGVEFNGSYLSIGVSSGAEVKALGWDVNRLVLNFQMEGANATGTVDAFARNLQVWRW